MYHLTNTVALKFQIMSYKYFLYAESDRNQLQVSDRQRSSRFEPGNYAMYFMTHFSNLTSISMPKANLLILNIFQINNKLENIPTPLIVYFKICIITIKYIDKLMCTLQRTLLIL